MQNGSRILLATLALFVSQTMATGVSAADEWEFATGQLGEDRWVPSFSITAGVTIQRQSGSVDSFIYPVGMPPGVPLGPSVDGSDQAVSPFVGFDLQLMSPALPLPTRPRIFIGAEMLPTFAADRDLAISGDPGCVRGPEPSAPCAVDEDGSRRRPFGENSANGQGARTSAEINTLAYGMVLGVAFPIQVGDRPLRLKPALAFMSYRVDASGLVVVAQCDPTNVCTDYTFLTGLPPIPGFLREINLSASRSRRYYTIGPGFDIEMDAGRYGPLGASLYTGMRAYAVMGDRTISYSTQETYNDQIGDDTTVANFEVEVDPWIYRAHLGIRFMWLGRD